MKTVVITGASRGIGSEIARQFAIQGFNTVICYNNSKQRADELLDELSKHARVITCKVDVSKIDEVDNMVSSVKHVFGNIDILVNCAGVSDVRMLIDSTESDYDFVMNTNFKGVYNTCKAIGKEMLYNQSGKIINISSIWGVVGGSCESVYSASKGAIISFSKALSKEFGPNGITVNCVAPGFIDTDMNKNVTKEVRDEIVENSSIKRLGTPKDVADLVLFLASEKADYITGQVIGVDGGWNN